MSTAYTQKRSAYTSTPSSDYTTSNSYTTSTYASAPQASRPLYILNNIERKGGICTCQKKGPCRGTCLG